MNIISVAETSSTIELAQRHLSSSLPYAVIATKQTAGIGQHGRRWESPAGNVYLTLACLPITYKLPMAMVCSTLVCDWLQQFGYHPTCKWANDILMQGKKLAGVLCKGAMQSGEWQHLLVSIGLNVNHSPLANSICMQDIDGVSRSTPELAVALAKHLATALRQPLTHSRKHYTCAGTELWYDDAHNYYLRNPDDNYLCLNALQQNSAKTLQLADSRGYHYAYQHPITVPTLTADIGNSSTKLTLFQVSAEPITLQACNSTQLHTALQRLQTIIAKNWVIYCVSVNTDNYATLQQTAKCYGFATSILNGCFRYTGNYNHQQLGADRLAILEACLNEYHQGQRIIVASLGTATTVDLLSDQGKHEGGLIVAGADTALQVLYETTQLPRSSHSKAKDELGLDTASCIYNGQLQCQIAFLERCQKKYRAEKLLLSGGYAAEVTAAMPQAIHDPILVAKGIKAMVWRT